MGSSVGVCLYQTRGRDNGAEIGPKVFPATFLVVPV
jgi:hypothetical protein